MSRIAAFCDRIEEISPELVEDATIGGVSAKVILYRRTETVEGETAGAAIGIRHYILGNEDEIGATPRDTPITVDERNFTADGVDIFRSGLARVWLRAAS